ncbi:MAG: electron transfer flavoprotein subunit alpha/FixB family protein [Chitinophagales bacterium]|nr:electron transfer flavoprotein subunit alpha/FixB family protein [Chitinophagales bacterium]
MSVLVFTESAQGRFKKSAREAAYYASKIAKQLGKETIAVALGTLDAAELASIGKSGVAKVLHVNDARFDKFDSGAFTKAIAQAAQKTGAEVVVLSFNNNGKALGPRLSTRLKAGLVSGVIALPETGSDFTVKKSVFSGKGFANYTIATPVKILSLNPNSIQVEQVEQAAAVEPFAVEMSDKDFAVQVVGFEKESAGVPLPEAEVVVSGGRGLKGPENWGMVEEMAKLLGAATACSRAVSDVHWRPHHEHVGQTGLTVRPNLYIAIGISGAIQHLAGVNGSKCIVVINNDPEAPFFKYADYGIVGDAFDVVPKLNEAFKTYFANNH